jgi:hypothetical protein
VKALRKLDSDTARYLEGDAEESSSFAAAFKACDYSAAVEAMDKALLLDGNVRNRCVCAEQVRVCGTGACVWNRCVCVEQVRVCGTGACVRNRCVYVRARVCACVYA